MKRFGAWSYTRDTNEIPEKIRNSIANQVVMDFGSEQVLAACWLAGVMGGANLFVLITASRIISKKTRLHQIGFGDLKAVQRGRFLPNVIVHTAQDKFDLFSIGAIPSRTLLDEISRVISSAMENGNLASPPQIVESTQSLLTPSNTVAFSPSARAPRGALALGAAVGILVLAGLVMRGRHGDVKQSWSARASDGTTERAPRILPTLRSLLLKHRREVEKVLGKPTERPTPTKRIHERPATIEASYRAAGLTWDVDYLDGVVQEVFVSEIPVAGNTSCTDLLNALGVEPQVKSCARDAPICTRNDLPIDKQTVSHMCGCYWLLENGPLLTVEGTAFYGSVATSGFDCAADGSKPAQCGAVEAMTDRLMNADGMIAGTHCQ